MALGLEEHRWLWSVVYRGRLLPILTSQIAQKTISVWGLPWTFRFLAGMMLVIGTVSPLVHIEEDLL